MITARLFAQNGGQVLGLTAENPPQVQLFEVPNRGDFVEIGVNPGIAFEVEDVVYLDGENGVRLIVTPHP